MGFVQFAQKRPVIRGVGHEKFAVKVPLDGGSFDEPAKGGLPRRRWLQRWFCWGHLCCPAEQRELDRFCGGKWF
jgi:hypothetical protein